LPAFPPSLIICRIGAPLFCARIIKPRSHGNGIITVSQQAGRRKKELMKSFIILTESIHYIEQNLYESFSRRDIARHGYVSLSMLEKLFRYALGMSFKTYVTKRRMTQELRFCFQIHTIW
jgi:YesN/AraC family two-component response regulator